MALVTKSFSVNITPGAIPETVHVSEHDVGRAYNVTLLDDNGNVFEIPSGTTAKIEGTLGKYPFETNANVSGNVISFELTESMTAYSGKAWTKIKLTQNSKPVSTCAFILDVDRAGASASAIINAPGFQEQINQGVAAYFGGNPPFFTLPSGGEAGQALVSDGNDGASWATIQGGSDLPNGDEVSY